MNDEQATIQVELASKSMIEKGAAGSEGLPDGDISMVGMDSKPRSLGSAAALASLPIMVFVLITAHACSGSTFSVLNLDFLARGGETAGLAGAVGDPGTAAWNPAGLAFGTGSTAFAGYMDYFVGVRGGTVGYMSMASGDYGYGIWASYLSSGSLTETGFDDPTGGSGGTFGYGELMTGLAGGTGVLPYLSFGGALKLARQDLDDYSTSGVFGDLSVCFKAYSPDLEVSSRPAVYTSYMARNILITRWGDDGGEAPRNSEVGVALEFPGGDLVVGLAFYFAGGGRREVRCGLEADLSPDFELRLGYRKRTGRMSDQANELPWERGLIAGFGLGLGPVRLDYTYEDASPLDNIHRFAITSTLSGNQGN